MIPDFFAGFAEAEVPSTQYAQPPGCSRQDPGRGLHPASVASFASCNCSDWVKSVAYSS